MIDGEAAGDTVTCGEAADVEITDGISNKRQGKIWRLEEACRKNCYGIYRGAGF